MKDRICHNLPITQVFDDDSLEQLGSYPRIPDAFRIDHHDGTSSTNAEAWRFTALDASGSEEEALTLEQ